MSLVRDTGGHGLPGSGQSYLIVQVTPEPSTDKNKRIEGARQLHGAVKEEAVGL